MNLHISIDNETTAPELIALAAFCDDLASNRASDTPPVVNTAAVPQAEPVRRGGRKPRATAPATTEAAAPATTEAAAPATTEAAAPAEPGKTSAEDWDAGGKTYTEADVQALATVVARAHGPDVVKEKIAELGGARIADLDAGKLNALGAFLETKK